MRFIYRFVFCKYNKVYIRIGGFDSLCESSFVSALDGRTTEAVRVLAVVSGVVCCSDLLQELYRL